MALEAPTLFYSDPAGLVSKLERSAAFLQLSKQEFFKAVLRRPALLSFKPSTLAANISQTVALLGIFREEFIAAALRQPQLFVQKPETINGNIERGAKLLGLDKKAYTDAALSAASLFFQKPETIAANVERSAALLGLPRDDFLALARRHFPLFYLRPENVASKRPYILKLCKILGGLDFATAVGSAPMALSNSKPRLQAAYIMAKYNLKQAGLSRLVTLPAAKTDALIRTYFTQQITDRARGARILEALYARGIIAEGSAQPPASA